MLIMDRLHQMTFRELKNELLHKKHTPEQELKIRKLMKDRAIKCKLRQRYLDMLPDSGDVILDESDFADNGKSYQLDELKDPRYCKDYVNNNLMSRLDNEMLIRQNNKKSTSNNYGNRLPGIDREKIRKDFIRPWA